MLSLAKLANLLGYVGLAPGLTLANARLVFELDPATDVLGRAGFYLAVFSAVLFGLGLVALALGWLRARAPRNAVVLLPAKSAALSV